MVAALAASRQDRQGDRGRLFISPKTVQANLARVYEKLGVRSRAELGARMASLAQSAGRAGAPCRFRYPYVGSPSQAAPVHAGTRPTAPD